MITRLALLGIFAVAAMVYFVEPIDCQHYDADCHTDSECAELGGDGSPEECI